ncbi:TatD family hydrolase [Gracilibacillus dipsosauri]|uniref:TatD family hydrolase n=1 Tax=Gracilibacillus dipsosauri TaxID=178340 RepID=UPI002409287A
MIDAHIHLDWYRKEERETILKDLKDKRIAGLIAISSDLASCKKVLSLSQKNKLVFPALGWHPEQSLPDEKELAELEELIRKHHHSIVAIGEVGLPYYLKKERPTLDINPYIHILERFINLAKEYHLPIVLHAVYEDADIVCDLLEKHGHNKAHFHWFKGSGDTMKRMIKNQYRISVTPDCVYEKEIQRIIDIYPLEFTMVETDGPWQFHGPFENKRTHPVMMAESIKQIATIKKVSLPEVERKILENTKEFYQILLRKLGHN